MSIESHICWYLCSRRTPSLTNTAIIAHRPNPFCDSLRSSQLISGFTSSGHAPCDAALISSLIFGAAHVSIGGKTADNLVAVGLHTLTGLCFGTTFILGGGNLAGCIAAHALYDLQVFYDTWWRANGQMDYAEGKGGEGGVEFWFHR